MNIRQAPVGTKVKFSDESKEIFRRIDRRYVTSGTGIVTGTWWNGIATILETRWDGQDYPRRIDPEHLVLA